MLNIFSEDETESINQLISAYLGHGYIHRSIYEYIENWWKFVEGLNNKSLLSIESYEIDLRERGIIQHIIDNISEKTSKKIQNMIKIFDQKFLLDTIPIHLSWLDILNPNAIEKMLYFRKPKHAGYLNFSFDISDYPFTGNELLIIHEIKKKYSASIKETRIISLIEQWRRIVDVINLGFPDIIEEYHNYLSIREIIQEIIDKVPLKTGNKIQTLIADSDKKFLECTMPLERTWLKIQNPTKVERMLYFRKPKNFGTFESLKKDFETSGL